MEATATGLRIDAGMAKLIVSRTFLRIGQDFVGLFRLLELFFSLRLSGLRSGWYFIASLRYAFLISSSDASRLTPNTS